jgi:hypothetical protein
MIRASLPTVDGGRAFAAHSLVDGLDDDTRF